MTPDQTKQVLAKIALVDNRLVDLATIAAWHEIIGHLSYDDAMQAVTNHRRNSFDYLTPAHVVAGARIVREQRSIEMARQRAKELTRPATPDMDYDALRRHTQTPQFIVDFKQGVIDGNAERAYWTEMRRTGGDTWAAHAAEQAVRNRSHER